MKRLIVFLLAFVLTLSGGNLTYADTTNAPLNTSPILLSSLSNEECYEQLYSMGVRIPDEFSDTAKSNFINGGLKEIVKTIEENPYHNFGINYTVAREFFENIRTVVNNYYSVQLTTSNAISTALEYPLLYSTVFSWNSSMANYNCYAYALDRSEQCDPGDFSNQVYDDTASISDVADMVKDDLLDDLGYSTVELRTTRPTSSAGWIGVIAIRKDTDYNYYFNDYHFAKYIYSEWNHKPGKTAVLTFNNAPSNAVDWTNECFVGSTNTYYPGDITYDSDIIYILFA